MKKPVLEAAVFLCGGCTMVMELVGSRILAPYLGTSLFVWTSLIGVILACLSAGYWWGGRLADRRPDARMLAGLIAGAAAGVALVAVLNAPVMLLVQEGLTDLRWAAVAATVVLFGVPSLLLGTVLPYAVRLKLEALDRAGATAGSLYALSTCGSIAGTFLAGFWLIAHFGSTTVLWIVAAALVTASLLVSAAGARLARAAMLVAALVGASQSESFGQLLRGPGFIDVDTAYNRVWIFDAPGPDAGMTCRVMQVNDENSSGMYLDSDALAFEYTRYYRLASHFKPNPGRALMIGGAAYSYPKDFLRNHPDARIDVVEIDPELTRLAREHFRLQNDPRLEVFHEDARTFLNRTGRKYDVIFGDAFQSFSVPFQLTTVEAMGRIHEALTDDGVLLLNVISSAEGRTGRYLRSQLATIKRHFPQVYVLAVADPEDGAAVQNFMIVALKSKSRPKLYSRDPQLDHYLHRVWIRPIGDAPVLTDDHAPVDHYFIDLISKLRQAPNPLRRRFSELLARIGIRNEPSQQEVPHAV